MSARLLYALMYLLLISCDACPDKSHQTQSDGRQGTLSADQFTGSSGITWIEGQHYEVIPAGASPTPDSQTVEVVEFFQYGCGHCNVLEPHLLVWHQHKSSYVRFVRVPLATAPALRPHARLYYTLEALGRIDIHGRNDLHHEVYDTIHRVGNKLAVFGNDETSFAMQLAFAMDFGVDPVQFTGTYRSIEVDNSVERARDLAHKYQIVTIPTLIVNGRYKTDAGRAGGEGRLLSLLDDLSTKEHVRVQRADH